MKILFVALSDSVHTSRWIEQIAPTGWDVRLFPSLDLGLVHPGLRRIPVYHALSGRCDALETKLRWQRHSLFKTLRAGIGMRLLPKLLPGRRVRQLLRVIDEFKPDIVHALEFQAAGYLTAAARSACEGQFPAWIVSNWGSDIYWFRQFPEHEAKIRDVLQHCDYYACECRRDIGLAEGMGLKGQVLPVIPNGGGLDLDRIAALRQPGPPSSRRMIMLKGYHHWVGRALVAIEALEACASLLTGYEVVIHSASGETEQAARALQQRTGLKMTLLPKGLPHEEILGYYGRSRIAVGLSLSDGASTSFLEALAMGAFPIQSWTACADEWVEDGTSGLLVPPEDVHAVENAMKRALLDDILVDRAAALNEITTRKRLDQRLIGEQARDFYRIVATARGIPNV